VHQDDALAQQREDGTQAEPENAERQDLTHGRFYFLRAL
jgi:hypothetical protein